MASTITVLSVLFYLLTFVASFAAPVLIIALVFRKLRPRPATATTPTPAAPKRRSPWRWLGLVPVAGISLFTGLMITSIGGALHPPLLRIAAPMACEGQLDITSTPYSYKPGQHGTAIQTVCVDPATGERESVQDAVLVWATLIFSGIVFVPLLIIGLLLMKLLRSAFGGWKSTSPSGLPGGFGSLGDNLRQAFDNAARRQANGRHDGGTRDVEESLRELKRLRDGGLIDEADFATRKTAILSRL